MKKAAVSFGTLAEITVYTFHYTVWIHKGSGTGELPGTGSFFQYR